MRYSSWGFAFLLALSVTFYEFICTFKNRFYLFFLGGRGGRKSRHSGSLQPSEPPNRPSQSPRLSKIHIFDVFLRTSVESEWVRSNSLKTSSFCSFMTERDQFWVRSTRPCPCFSSFENRCAPHIMLMIKRIMLIFRRIIKMRFCLWVKRWWAVVCVFWRSASDWNKGLSVSPVNKWVDLHCWPVFLLCIQYLC